MNNNGLLTDYILYFIYLFSCFPSLKVISVQLHTQSSCNLHNPLHILGTGCKYHTNPQNEPSSVGIHCHFPAQKDDPPASSV